jgi:hypothetical protein
VIVLCCKCRHVFGKRRCTKLNYVIVEKNRQLSGSAEFGIQNRKKSAGGI